MSLIIECKMVISAILNFSYVDIKQAIGSKFKIISILDVSLIRTTLKL